MQIYLPAGQTADTWTEQVSVMIYANQHVADPVAPAQSIDAAWRKACPEAEPAKILSGKSNGYATATLLLKCPLLASSGKPEAGLTHLIAGKDNFYMIQHGRRFLPSPDKVKQMIRYMASVKACDDRAPDHRCPTEP